MAIARARIVWVIIACLAWKFGGIAEARGLGRESSVMLMIVTASFGFGLAALAVALSKRAEKWLEGWRLFAILTLFFITFGVGDWIARSRTPYTFTTDAHVYTDYACRVLLAGKNPYDTSLYGAIVSMRTPIELQTPLDNGGLSDRLAYPSLSVLYLIPFIKLGIPTTIAYALAFYGCLVVIYRMVPHDFRPLMLFPFFVDESFLAFSFGGLTDTVWALLLCLVVVAWRRPSLAAFCFGLACSYKQHPWLLAPFLFVRIARENSPPFRVSALLRFFGIAILTFVALNLPFALWSPRAWLAGVVEPLATAMVPMGEGLSGIVAFGGASIPKAVFTVGFWGMFAVLLGLCATWRAGHVLGWVAPSIAFFFNFRSLSSYWYFNLLPFVVELALSLGSTYAASDVGDAPERPPLFRVDRRVAASLVGGFLVVLVALAGVISLRKNATVDVSVEEPMRSWAQNVFRIDLKLTNRGSSTITPRFWVQGANFQPLPWYANGPPELAAGASVTYSINAASQISQFDIARGARITVSDLNSSLRKTVDISPDLAALSPRAIPNSKFRFWDVSRGAPTHWILSQEGSAGANALPKHGAPHHAVELFLEPDALKRERELIGPCGAVPTCYAATASMLRSSASDSGASEHRVELSTDVVAHAGSLSLWTFTPRGANVSPELAERYGVRLWFGDDYGGDRSVVLLLGGEPADGVTPEGTPYVVIPGAREEWRQVTIDLGDIQRRFAPNVYPKTTMLARFPLIDIPAISLRVALFYASRRSEVGSALFGELDDGLAGKDSVDDVIAEIDTHPGAIDAWRARYEGDLKNPTRARQYLERARRNEAHPELDLQAGFQALTTGRHQDAQAAFKQVEGVFPIDARLGLGIAHMQAQDPSTAKVYFEDVLARLGTKHRLMGVEYLQKLGATFGLADALALLHDCEGVERSLEGLAATEREAYRKNGRECR